MSPRANNILGVTAGLVVAIGFAMIFSNWSDPITATVVDSETGQPIEGVVVVADWMLKGGFEGGNPVGHLALMEAVTDKAGRFHFPGWGPRFTIPLVNGLRGDEPEMYFFKNGYGARVIWNEGANRWHRWQVKSTVNGTHVKLEKFLGTPIEYLKNIKELGSSLDSSLLGDDKACPWKKMPRMIRALYRQGEWFGAHGLEGQFNSPYWQLFSNEEYYLKIGCGSAKEFLTGTTK